MKFRTIGDFIMHLRSKFWSQTAIVGIFLAALPASVPAQVNTKAAVDTAVDAYVYGYSLITTEVTRVQMSNVAKAEGMHAPMGEFSSVKRYPSGDFRGVSAPNADTLYSLAWLDLSE